MSLLNNYTEQYHIRVFLSSFSILTIIFGLILFTQNLTVTSGEINETTASLFVLVMVAGVVGFFYYVLTMTADERLNKPVFALLLINSSVFLVSVLVEVLKELIKSQLVSEQTYVYVFIPISLLILVLFSVGITVYSTISHQKLQDIQEEPEQ